MPWCDCSECDMEGALVVLTGGTWGVHRVFQRCKKKKNALEFICRGLVVV